MVYNEKTKQATMKYMAENLEEVRFRVKQGERAELMKAAEAAGYSAYSRFIIDAVNEKAGRKVLTMPMEKGTKRKSQCEDVPEPVNVIFVTKK